MAFKKIKDIIVKNSKNELSKNKNTKVEIEIQKEINSNRKNEITNTHKMFSEIGKLQKKYKKDLDCYKNITDELWETKLYSKAIAEKNIFIL